MFDWAEASFAFFAVMALGIVAWMIGGIALWLENKFGFAAGLLTFFVFIAILVAIAEGVGAV